MLHGIDRFGFPLAFLDRKIMLDILFKTYPDPGIIRLGERVTMLETLSDGVAVHTATGRVYRGDFVVGADGVHSVIRKEIWKALANTMPKKILNKEKTSKEIRFR